MVCVKALAESPGLTSIPSTYTFTQNQQDHQVVSEIDPEDSIPVIDFSLLNSSNPDHRSKVIQDLGKACRDWGFFMVINHNVPKNLMEMMMDACQRFFNLKEEEKREFAGKHVLDPIRCGTSFNASVEKVFFWRDFLKVFVHPEFHSPNKPVGFSEISQEYCKRTRQVARELLKGIAESLGLESCYIDRAMNLDSGFQILIANLYPPCPQPELAMGMPPHSDHGLLTLLTHNGICGLQLLHNGKWVNVNAVPNSFLVNTGDHIEVINHSVPENLTEKMMDACQRFFNLTEEEKREFAGKHVLDPIRCGTSFNASVEKVFFWRDFLKVIVHPEFHSPDKPGGFSETLQEYRKRTQHVSWELLKGISESLGLESCYIHRAMNLDSGLQILTANLYPPCPQPELAMGMPPHSDHGLLTLLTQNGIDGLQLLHNRKWVNVKAVPNSFLVNTADHIEIISNGKYKGVVHRAVVNNKTTRISLAITSGPSLDTVVGPSKELIEVGSEAPAYVGSKYKDYLEFQQSNNLDNKSALDRVRI